MRTCHNGDWSVERREVGRRSDRKPGRLFRDAAAPAENSSIGRYLANSMQ